MAWVITLDFSKRYVNIEAPITFLVLKSIFNVTYLPNLELLSLRNVLQLPKASNIGLQLKIFFSRGSDSKRELKLFIFFKRSSFDSP